MGTSYPDRTNATGVWKLSDITKNKTTDGTYPGSSGHLALCGGGRDPSASSTVDSFSLVSSGNATDFGDLSVARMSLGNCSSNVRLVFTGGEDPSASNVMDYLHFATTGNAADFGNLGQAQGNTTKGTGSDTKAVTTSGNQDADLLQTFNYTTLGDASSFGNLTAARNGAPQGTGDGVRGTYAGGMAPNQSDVIDFVQITTNANAVDFGDLTVARGESSSVDSKTRSVVFAGRTNSPSSGTIINVIDTYQISSLGNAVDFGDMVVATRNLSAGLSDTVRGYCAGGQTPSITNRIERITIASAGNATDFGDLTVARDAVTGNTARHGGLSQFIPRAPELYSPTGKVVPRGGGVGNIGVSMGRQDDSNSNTMGFITISTTGNEIDFGDATVVGYAGAIGSKGGSTRGISSMSGSPGTEGELDYINYHTKGNASSFGNLSSNRSASSGCSNDTRQVMMGGNDTNVMDYITIATIGNAADFGDLTTNNNQGAGTSSTTRGLRAGGITPGASDVIDYITIANTGNATDFGNLSQAKRQPGSANSTTRAVFAGGLSSPGSSDLDEIEYVTIASTGNVTDFGNLLAAKERISNGHSNQNRGVFQGGHSNQNVMQYITIATTGNATDFGDLTSAASYVGSVCNGHGGLS